MMPKLRSILVGLVLFMLLTLNLPISILFAQGSLTPPGAPAPTMKTLSQIEPRTPISSLPFTISVAGSYYVTTNLSVSSAVDGITIAADNVAIDLCGFALSGPGGLNNGITASGARSNLALRNGTVRNWGTGVNLAGAASCEFEQLRLFTNTTGAGLNAGNNCLVVDCNAGDNLFGIVIHDGGILRNCIVNGCSSNGFACGSRAILSDCTSTSNGAWGIVVAANSSLLNCSAMYNSPGVRQSGGILTGDNCKVIGCTANGNLTTNAMLSSNGTGIDTGNNCLVKDCVANAQYTGIVTGTYSLVQNCVVNSLGTQNNGISPGDFGIVRGCLVKANYAIQATTSCLIEDNLSASVTDADIHVYGTNNVVIGNSLLGQYHSMTVGANNVAGTVEIGTSVNTNKNPHANFAQ